MISGMILSFKNLFTSVSSLGRSELLLNSAMHKWITSPKVTAFWYGQEITWVAWKNITIILFRLGLSEPWGLNKYNVFIR